MSSFNVLIAKYPDYIPAIVITDLEIKKKKYLIPKDVNFGTAMITIRKNITNLKPCEAIIYILDDKILSSNMMMYELKKKKDFLYIKIIKENVFG
jgi:hypothetical protein